MLLSIIIPVKNRAHIISDTLDSLKTESFKDIEIIVVDNNSSDNLIQIIKQYKEVKYIKNKSDKEIFFPLHMLTIEFILLYTDKKYIYLQT